MYKYKQKKLYSASGKLFEELREAEQANEQQNQRNKSLEKLLYLNDINIKQGDSK